MLLARMFSGQYVPSAMWIEQGIQQSKLLREHIPRSRTPYYDTIRHQDIYAKELNIGAAISSKIGDIVVPGLYSDDNDLVEKCQQEIQQELYNSRIDCEIGRNRIAKLAFDALIGTWSFERTITDALTNSVQKVTGNIQYSYPLLSNHHQQLQKATVPLPFLEDDTTSTRINCSDIVSYREDGCITLPNGVQMDVYKEYVYEHNKDCIDIYFVDEIPKKLFLSLKFIPNNNKNNNQQQNKDKVNNSSNTSNDNNSRWIMATSDHLCIKDLYKGTFEIELDGICAKQIIQTYRVKGPAKDYTSRTILIPPTVK